MFWLAVTIITALAGARAQLTAQSSVAAQLRECYTEGSLLDRNNLPPTTIPVLIDIIQQIEDSVNMNIRELSAAILHAYRQDGIEFHQADFSSSSSSKVLRYAPTFHSFHRHRILLTKLIPSTQILSEDTLPSVLKCALHHMLSTTVDARLRGDESQCNQLSQYRALRSARHAPGLSDDVEMINLALLKKNDKHGQIKQYDPNNDVEITNFGDDRSQRQLLGNSQCPLGDGIVHTAWGAVSAGNLIAGIAAGTAPQTVSVNELIKGYTLNYQNVPDVNSLFAATLSGDLAEAVLIQGTEREGSMIQVGAAGGWNSTQARKHYLLQSQLNLEFTDPEIRGDIDGYVIGKTMPSTLGIYNDLKLSQLLDMYYSKLGVYNANERACNRKVLAKQYLVDDEMIRETFSFSAALDTQMPLRGTIVGGLEELARNAVTSFQTYTTSNLNDKSCVTTDTATRDFRLRTNLYIVMDSSWAYQSVYPAISYLIDQLEVGKFGSSVTLLSAFDGSIILNKTFSPAAFHANYTLTKHQSILMGANLATCLANLKDLMYGELQYERNTNYVGGNSTVLLFLLNTGNLLVNEVAWETARQINETVPDLRVIFATSNNQVDNLWNLVRDPYEDIKVVSLNGQGTNVEATMDPILERILHVGKRIINPICGFEFAQVSSGTKQFDDFVEPGYVNYYSVSPNYFYGQMTNRKLRIARTSGGIGNLVVCHSRSVVQPRTNKTNNFDQSATTCQSIQSSGNVEILMDNPCYGYSTIGSCPPFYISVEWVATINGNLPASCTDRRLCRFPYNMRYQVSIEEFGCYSNARTITASLFFIVTAFLLSFIN